MEDDGGERFACGIRIGRCGARTRRGIAQPRRLERTIELLLSTRKDWRQGIRHGMRRSEAEAICPNVVTVISDRAIEAVRFEPVARAIEEIIPSIELAFPGLVFAPVAGAIKYFGGEAPLLDHDRQRD